MERTPPFRIGLFGFIIQKMIVFLKTKKDESRIVIMV